MVRSDSGLERALQALRVEAPQPTESTTLDQQRRALQKLEALLVFASEAKDQLQEIRLSFTRTQARHKQLIKKCQQAREAVTSSSVEAQSQYGAGKVVEKLEETFEKGADFIVTTFAKHLLSDIKRHGKITSVPPVAELLEDLRRRLDIPQTQCVSETMDAHWEEVENQLTTMINERLPTLCDNDVMESLKREVSNKVHALLLQLYTDRTALQVVLSQSVVDFEATVRTATEKVNLHRDYVARLDKSSRRMADLKDLERRAAKEAAFWEWELLQVVLELVKLSRV